tara:strand:+ start:1403 stop:2017 length:615 start_codon:yes stop_codon:yes gene_type:complete
MKILKTIGIFNIIIGIIAFIAPVKFYSIASKLFIPEVSPPFSFDAVQTTTFLLFIPGIMLVINGIALIAMGYKLEHVPEMKAYSESGDYLGKVKGVEVDSGELEKVEIEGEEVGIYKKENMTAVDDVVLIKEDEKNINEDVKQHGIVGKEVYDESGVYYGKIESVTLDEQDKLLEFMTIRGNTRTIINSSEISSSNGVILVNRE